METPADFKFEPGPESASAVLSGTWTAEGLCPAAASLARASCADSLGLGPVPLGTVAALLSSSRATATSRGR